MGWKSGAWPAVFHPWRSKVYEQIVPPDAKVDPSSFPEDKYPVYCPACGYLLRGLTCDRCPECGKQFDHGRLLVEQYVIGQGERERNRRSLYAKWMMFAGLSVFLMLTAMDRFSKSLSSSALPMVHLVSGKVFESVATVVSLTLMFAGNALLVRDAIARREKCATVLKGMDRNGPTFRAAQRSKWIRPAILGIAVITVFVVHVGSNRYFVDSPWRITIPLAFALVLFVLLYMGKRLWIR